VVSDAAEREVLALARTFLRVQTAPLVPEVRLYLAAELVPLWEATEWRAGAPRQPPFWAYAWPGSQLLARHVLDQPALVQGRRVLDFGAGSGLAAIAAAQAGAAAVVAADLDPLAAAVQRLNADLNGVELARTTADLTEGAAELTDVVLAGDVCYERDAAARHLAWLRRLAASGTLVLLADPGRAYAPRDGLELISTRDVPTLHELESVASKTTRLWRLLPA
jgi:predicted nicotinamide N-methyase